MLDKRAFTLKSQGNNLLHQIISEAKVSIGFKLSSENTPEKHKFITYKALWDTGATRTVITNQVVRDLGLKPIGLTQVHHANGVSQVNVYVINIFLPNNVGVSLLQVTEGILTGFDILIGMDIISYGDFSITNYNGSTTFSFQIPSQKEIDFTKDQPLIITNQQLARNSKCHCGSGKKYKQCHGK